MLQIQVDASTYEILVRRKGDRTWYQYLYDELVLEKRTYEIVKDREENWQRIYNELKAKIPNIKVVSTDNPNEVISF
jgi:hypothetical protein